MDEELREGTPRPWNYWIDSYDAGTMFVGPSPDEPPVAESIAQDDAALIIAAVNDYDRLRRIEAAVRGPVLGAFDVLASLREVARQAGNADLIAALEPARHAEAALRTALGED
jgi:hypothetical protein